MAFTGFTQADFKVFDLQGFQPRMSAIRGQIRPKLEALGAELLPAVTQAAVSCRHPEGGPGWRPRAPRLA